ncbi:MAG: helix-hairpin-helix domain-containing protein [Thiotrichaceae bacterium]
MLWRKYGLYVVGSVMLVWASMLYAADKVDINTADALTLAHVMEGIGEKKAEAIVKYRQEHGFFNSIQELEKVAGIGAKTIEKNKDKLVASVDVNQASAETLVKALDGISTESAAALVEYRGKHGAFKSIEEIAQVPGLAKEAFERNKERFSIIIPKAGETLPIKSEAKPEEPKTEAMPAKTQ